MELNKIISIKGEKGLFKIIKPLRQGILLETLDKNKKRIVKNITLSKIVNLGNVAIYTKATTPTELEDVLKIINSNKNIFKEINSKSSLKNIKDTMAKVMPNYDDAKLLPSQIIKILYWYKIIIEYAPEIFADKAGANKTTSKVSDVVKKTDSSGEEIKETFASEGSKLVSKVSDTVVKDKKINSNKEEALLKKKNKKLLIKDKKSEDHASIDTKATPKNRVKNPVRKNSSHNPDEK